MLDRRHLLALLASSVSTRALVTPAMAQAPAMSRITAYAFSFSGLETGNIRPADYFSGRIF